MGKRSMVHGVGINDADYTIQKFSGSGSSRARSWVCPYYCVWANMLKRCYASSEKWQPSYVNCTVSEEWHTFSVFRKWMDSQDWQGMDLDKDLACPGNKIYGPEYCLFIDPTINSFLSRGQGAKGNFPIGVCFDKINNKFMASCKDSFTGKSKWLGRFSCPNEAHEAWRREKHSQAIRFADIQTDPRIARALRNYYLPGMEHK